MSRYNAAFTMFVFLRGRPVLEYYFGLKDAFCAANDGSSAAGADILSLSKSYRGKRSAQRPVGPLKRRTDP